VDCVIRMSHVATHQYGNEFLPGGIVGAKFNLPLSTVERRLLASQWTDIDEMVAAPGGHPVMTIPTICAARGPKLSIGGEIFASTDCRSKRSSYILTALISADGVPYDHPGQVVSYVEIYTDVVPARVAELMHPIPGDTDSMAAMMANYRRHIAMNDEDFELFVELDVCQETYITKPRTHAYAFVAWFGRNGDSTREWQNDHITMGILPVHRIKSRYTPVFMTQGDKTTFEILPIPRRIRLAASYVHDD
jgi:hypothetical protein